MELQYITTVLTCYNIWDSSFMRLSDLQTSPQLAGQAREGWQGFQSAEGWEVVGCQYGSPNTTIYYCRQYILHTAIVPHTLYAFKNMKIASFYGTSFCISDIKAKHIRQINSEIKALELLQNCERVVYLYQVLSDHRRKSQEWSFLHHFLGKDATSSQGYACLIMEYCEGGSIHQMRMQQKHAIQENNIIEMMADIIEIMLALRKYKIVHRDLNSSNLLMSSRGVKVCDFDTAFIEGFSDHNNVFVPLNNKKIAPQLQLLNSLSFHQLQSITSHQLYQMQKGCDLYGIGTVLYQLMTNQMFSKDIYKANIANMRKSLTYSQQLINAVAKLLNEDPQQRMTLEQLIIEFPPVLNAKIMKKQSNATFQKIPQQTTNQNHLNQKSESTSLSFSIEDAEYYQEEIIKQRKRRKYFTIEDNIESG